MIIKVCGMRDPVNIRAVEQLAVDWIGFIFYPESKRYVPDKELIINSILHCQKKKVGVFVNASTDEILEKAARFRLNILQLHGEESIAQCRMLREKHFQLIKAFSIETADDLKMAQTYENVVDYFLFDTKCAGYGGSGKCFDWSVLHAYHGNVPFLLSGGISPESIPDLLQFHHPQMIGIDVNSGFETAPALKDVERLQLFAQQLKNKVNQ